MLPFFVEIKVYLNIKLKVLLNESSIYDKDTDSITIEATINDLKCVKRHI